MDYKRIADSIGSAIDRRPTDIAAYNDLFSLLRSWEEQDFKEAHGRNKQLMTACAEKLREVSGKDVEQFYQQWRKCLLFEAPHDFDSYLRYLEIDRKPEARFYAPRRRIMKTNVVDKLQRLADDELDELFISMPPRVGKLLADDTPVLTVYGWKNHGDLKKGDMVFNPDGIPVPILGVMPKHHTTHTVKFSDGSTIDCHFRHEWKVYDRRFGKVRTLETQEMIGHLENGKQHGDTRGHRYNFMIEPRSAIVGVPTVLKVKPYTMGAWLGDGTNRQPRVTGVDEEIIESIVADGYAEKHRYVHKTTGVTTVEFAGLRSALKDYGMCQKHRTEKYIPEEYLIADVEDRLELLAGLLDTDGTLRKKENRYDFTTSDRRLKDTFIDLIHTFGWRVSVKEVQPHTSTSGIVGKLVYWVISFNPTEFIPCRLSRKQLDNFSKQRRISIVSIEPSEEKQGNCITVLGGMYLAGRNMIPTHNTSILMFFVTWLLGRDSEKSNLYSAYSDVITSAFYNGVLEIIQDPVTYLWKDVFPEAKIVSTNSKDETLNIDRKKRYPSLTCRSLYGTLNGACDCNGFEISDDLIGGIEEAMNKDRLMSAWSKVDNNLLPRAKEKAKILWCGTRWSMIDPAGIRMDILQNDDRFKNRRFEIVNLPALDENDESQFYYDYDVGFSTEYYRQRRASFERTDDMASWSAQYQGLPIERDGSLFSPADFRYYNGELPDGEPDRIFMAVDPAFGGGDFVASPVCYQYGDDIYVHDVVYDNGDKRKTQPLLVNAILKHNVQAAQFEATKATASYKEGVEEALKSRGYRLNITTKAAPTDKAKYQRVYDKASEIKERMIFREGGKRSKMYEKFMQNVFSYTMYKKNAHDDAPDSLVQAMCMVRSLDGSIVTVFQRPF